MEDGIKCCRENKKIAKVSMEITEGKGGIHEIP